MFFYIQSPHLLKRERDGLRELSLGMSWMILHYGCKR